MHGLDAARALHVCLVCTTPVLEAAVRPHCAPPHQLQVFSLQGLVNPHHTLSDHGAAIVRAATGADAVLIEWAFAEAPAINTLCHHVRSTLTAPTFLLCRDGAARAACIAAGGDDALTLPLDLDYLQAKVLSHRRLIETVRRSAPSPDAAPADPDVRRVGGLRLDLSAHRFFIRDVRVDLTPREFALLAFLMDHVDTLCTREHILDAVWGITFDTGTNMVDVYMYFLRKKLEAHGLKDMIQTVRGYGYRLVDLAGTELT